MPTPLKAQIEHARLCFGIASALAGHPISPGEYRSHQLSIDQDLVGLLENIAADGGVYELQNVLRSARRLQDDDVDPTVR